MDCSNCEAEIEKEAKPCDSSDVQHTAAPRKPNEPSDAEKNAKRGGKFVRLSIICPAVPLIALELLLIIHTFFWINWWSRFDIWQAWFVIGYLVMFLMLITGSLLGIGFGIAALHRRRWWGIAGIVLALAATPNPLAYLPGLLYSRIYNRCSSREEAQREIEKLHKSGLISHNPVQKAMCKNTPLLIVSFHETAKFSEGGKTLRRYNHYVADVRGRREYAIPDGVTTIGDGSFSSVTEIGNHTIIYGGTLTSVTIPSSVTTIGNEAFAGCKELRSVTIPEGVTTIGSGAFRYCKNLMRVTIPSSVTTIGDRAFYECKELRSVTIPEGVTTIGDETFRGCKNLTGMTIPSSVTTIGNGAFEGCGLTSVTIPASVTTIGGGAFEWCENLTSVTIQPGVTEIGIEAFAWCEKLTTVTIPNSMTAIGDETFRGCKNLTSVTIPEGVKTIGNSAFERCSKLTSVTIPASVTTIGERAFERCPCEESVQEQFKRNRR